MTDINDAPSPALDSEDILDGDNRLTDEFVRSVSDAVEENDSTLAQELVNPLHNADIADLFELVDEDERAPLAGALGDMVSADVLAEMN
ncbi:MAG: magnesium transporter, partial [Parasphingorhabdus sp.]